MRLTKLNISLRLGPWQKTQYLYFLRNLFNELKQFIKYLLYIFTDAFTWIFICQNTICTNQTDPI